MKMKKERILEGRSGDMDDKYLLIQPDVTFFDRSGKPILFIELVATHKVSIEKLIKIKRLGIDAIEVIIPKSSPQEIEDTFLKSTKTKWIYNGEEERTQYVRVSNSNSEGVSSTDELQRRLFEETYECRTAQINNLIRAIKKCLGAKPYTDTASGFRDEISRIERNTERDRERLQGLQENIQRELNNEFEDSRTNNSERRRILSSEEKRFRESGEKLEGRYKSKRGELEREEKLLDRAIAGEIENHRGEGKSFDERRREIERDAKSVQENSDEAERQVRRIQEDQEGLPEEFERLTEEVLREFERNKTVAESQIRDIEGRTEKSRDLLKRDRARLEEQYERIREGTLKAMSGEDDQGNIGLSSTLQEFIRTRKLLRNLPNVQHHNKRLRTAWESFRSGTYKNWKK